MSHKLAKENFISGLKGTTLVEVSIQMAFIPVGLLFCFLI